MTPNTKRRDGQALAFAVAGAIYGDWRTPDGRKPETDADMLLAVAAKLDEVDDLMDAFAAEQRIAHRTGRDIQNALRRIATEVIR